MIQFLIFLFQTTLLEMMLKCMYHFCMKTISNLPLTPCWNTSHCRNRVLNLGWSKAKINLFLFWNYYRKSEIPQSVLITCLQKHHIHAVHSLPIYFFPLVCWNVFLKRSFEDSHFVREWKLLVVTSLEMGQWLMVTPFPCQTDRASDNWEEEE